MPEPAVVEPAVVSVEAVAERIVALIAEQTGYPAEMLAADLDLEADLGIDTVKQAELFATDPRANTASNATTTSNSATTPPSTTSSASSATAPHNQSPPNRHPTDHRNQRPSCPSRRSPLP